MAYPTAASRRPTPARGSKSRLKEWGRYLGDPTITSAILDRLATHAIRINIDGPSYRQHIARERVTELGGIVAAVAAG